ncbi:hypothetical protein AN960_05395 [Bacillus sp. FJAT-25509]|nr:hypothetical protein AN960_05395 [Bacillus sp. FJAT-25509]
MIENKNSRIIKTTIYFGSFLVVFPLSIPLMIIMTFMTDDPSVTNSTIDWMWYGYLAFISLSGSTVLNFIFKHILGNKNTKKTWIIYILHLILIPSTTGLYETLLFQ